MRHNAQYQLFATTRNPEKLQFLHSQGVGPLLFGSPDMVNAIKQADAIFVSPPPDITQGDDFIKNFGQFISAQQYIGYLSTTGVYGDKNGAWVDETTLPDPTQPRAIMRLRTEAHYQNLGGHIFRLSGIYGEGRNCLLRLINGIERRIYKPKQYFSRIHNADISQICLASMVKPNPGNIYNCADDEPSPPHLVVEYGASLLNMPPPPLESLENAQLSEMARSFYSDNKRVRNNKIKKQLGVKLMFPNYRVGLQNIYEKLQNGQH